MSDRVPVRVGDAVFEVEVAGTGPANIGIGEALSFDGVRDTIEALASEIGKVWAKVKPDEATVVFGLALDARTGRLTGLLLDGKASANFTISITWKATPEHGPTDADPGR